MVNIIYIRLDTVECRYNAFQFITILHMAPQWQQTEHRSNLKLTTDTPYFALTVELWDVYYEILKKIARVITAPHCMFISNNLYVQCLCLNHVIYSKNDKPFI